MTESQRKFKLIREVQGLDGVDTREGVKGSPDHNVHEMLR